MIGNFISVATGEPTEAVHGFLHGAFPGYVQIEACHLARVESHHVISVRDATTSGESTHGALNVFPEMVRCSHYSLTLHTRVEIDSIGEPGSPEVEHLTDSRGIEGLHRLLPGLWHLNHQVLFKSSRAGPESFLIGYMVLLLVVLAVHGVDKGQPAVTTLLAAGLGLVLQ